MSSPAVIVLSPVRVGQGPYPNWQYYDVPEEFPNDPLKYMLRWANYPWAYGTPYYGTYNPPGG